MSFYLIIKSMHIISVVCWFAGLFYIVRLFIYHMEAQAKDEPKRLALTEQFTIMETRLWYGITVPSMLATVVFGLLLIVAVKPLSHPWFHAKLLFLMFLFGYHLFCGFYMRALHAGSFRFTSKQLRFFNEIATLLLFIIVFVSILKRPSAWLVAVVLFGVLIGAAFFVIGKKRKKYDAD